jgi:hypothetical protein
MELPVETPAAAGTVLPYERAELRAMYRSPLRVFDAVLGERPRLSANIARALSLRDLIAILLGCSALVALPYGLVLDAGAAWRVIALFLGSVVICLPALRIFGGYIGWTWRSGQYAALALVVSAVAALFTFAFAPILWFLRATMHTADWIDAHDLSVVMLALALLAGLAQLSRTLRDSRVLHPMRCSHPLVLAWQVLLIGITLRMARVLGLTS